MTYLNSLTAAVLLSAFTTPAHAEYMPNYQGWSNLTEVEKSAYAMGAFDGHSLLITGDTHEGLRIDIMECAVELNLTSIFLVEIINSEYRDLENWKYAASQMLFSGLNKVCRDIIKRRHEERGETPLSER